MWKTLSLLTLAARAAANGSHDAEGHLIAGLAPEELALAEERAALKEDVNDECGQFGDIVEMRVPVSANASCDIYVRFAMPDAAQKAMAALQGRKFDGRTVDVSMCSMSTWDSVVDGA